MPLPPVNLANVNLSLAQFDAISAGKYNAGEVKLSGENALVKVNNHVSQRGKNNVTISHAETIAIKEAFVRALSQGGVAGAALERVRRDLGLGTDGTVDKKLAERSVRPLTRQQIRDILDSNAVTLNQHAGENGAPVRTSDAIYSTVDAHEKAERARRRSVAASELNRNREMELDDGIALFQRLVTGDVDFLPPNKRNGLADAARRLRDRMFEQFQRNPSDERRAVASFELPGGQTVTLDTGRSELGFLRHLDDLIIRLDGGCDESTGDVSYSNRTLNVVNDFRLVESYDAQKDWAQNLASDPDRGFKARTVAAMLMHERGVEDWATLAKLNAVSDADALRVLNQILDQPEARGEDLAFGAFAGIRPAPEGAGPAANQKAYIPATSPRAFNKSLPRSLLDHMRLPPAEFRPLLEEIRTTMLQRFGPEVASICDRISGCLRTVPVRNIVANLPAGVRATPANLRQALMDSACVTVAEQLFRRRIEALVAAEGVKDNAQGLVSSLRSSLQGLKERLAACRSAQDVDAIVADNRALIERKVHQFALATRLTEGCKEAYRAVLAAQLGIPPSALGDNAFAFSRVREKCLQLTNDINTGRKVCENDEAIRAAFQEVFEAQAATRAAAWRIVDGYHLPAALADTLKAELLALRRVDDFHLQSLIDASTDFPLAELEAAVAPTTPIAAAMEKILAMEKRFTHLLRAVYPPDAKEIGGDEQLTITHLLGPLLFHGKDELARKLQAFLAMPAAQNFRPHPTAKYKAGECEAAMHIVAQLLEVRPPTADEAIAALGRPEALPAHAQALYDAARELGLGDRPLDDIKKEFFAPTGTVVRQIADALRAGGAVDSAAIKAAALGSARLRSDAARHAAIAKLDALVRENNIGPLTPSDVRDAFAAIEKRDPQLRGRIAAGANVPAEAAAQIDAMRDAALAILRAYAAVREANGFHKERAVDAIAAGTGLDRDFVARKLNTHTLGMEGGSLIFLREDLRDEFAKPNCDFAKLEREAVLAKCQSKIDSFVAKKCQFAGIVRSLPVPEAVRASLISQTLERANWTDPAIALAARNVVEDPVVRGAMSAVVKTLSPENLARMDDTAAFEAFAALGRATSDAVSRAIPADAGFGGDEFSTIYMLVNSTLVASAGPQFTALLQKLELNGRLDRINDYGAQEREKASLAQADAQFADQEIAAAGWVDAGAGNGEPGMSKRTENAIRHTNSVSQGVAFVAHAQWYIRTVTTDGFAEQGSPAGAAALAAGYAPAELAGLQSIADLYRESVGCTRIEAQKAVLDPISPARRLFSYGGRFVESAANFKAGLELLKLYGPWYRKFVADAAARKSDRLESLNAAAEVCKPAAERAFERVLFEEIAVNPAIPLDTKNPDAAFGMAANPAMRFAGRNFMTSVTATYLQIPPARRGLVYAVFDVYNPLRAVGAPKPYDLSTQARAVLLSRILKNYDAVEELRRAGTLDREHLTQLLFGDLGLPAGADNRTLGDAITRKIEEAVTQHFGGLLAGADKLATIGFMLVTSGATLNECVAAVAEGRALPNAPFVVDMSPKFESADGTATGGREALLDDLNRATVPTRLPGEEEVLEGDMHFTVRIGGETLLSRNGLSTDPEVREASNRIADRVAAFVGEGVHPAQLYAVYYAMTQSATSRLKDAFRDRNIATDEHMPVVFTLSKNAETGAVTIRYSEPEGFPVKFHWEATVGVDGKTVNTPLVIE